MSIYKNHIAIIGAGISGLMLGIILKKHNIPCVVFEKYNTVSEYGAGISISPNGLKILEELNLLNKLKMVSANPYKTNFYSNSSMITSISVDVVTTSRQSLYKVLLDEYLSLQGDILFDHELIDINLSKKTLSFLNNINITVAHIAACDGIKSLCRDKSFINNQSPVYSGYSVWRSIINTNQEDINFYLGSHYHAVTYPINDSQLSFVAALKNNKNNSESWKEKGNFDDIKSELPSFLLDKYLISEHKNHLYKWGVYTRPKINDLFKENITFLGDAAHPIVPFIGQGGCLALEDAYIFGNLIKEFKYDFLKIQNLYKSLRLKRIRKIQKASMNQARLNHINNNTLITIRNMMMRYTNIISYRTKNIWQYDAVKIINKIIS